MNIVAVYSVDVRYKIVPRRSPMTLVKIFTIKMFYVICLILSSHLILPSEITALLLQSTLSHSKLPFEVPKMNHFYIVQFMIHSVSHFLLPFVPRSVREGLLSRKQFLFCLLRFLALTRRKRNISNLSLEVSLSFEPFISFVISFLHVIVIKSIRAKLLRCRPLKMGAKGLQENENCNYVKCSLIR